MRDKLHGISHVYGENGAKPIEVVTGSTIFMVCIGDDANTDVFPLNKTVVINREKQIADAGTTGTLRNALTDIYKQQPALVLVHRVPENTDIAQQTAELVGTLNQETNSYTGVNSALAAEADVGFKPRLTLVPEYSHVPAVAQALELVSKRLGAIPIIEGRNDGMSAAIQDVQSYDEAIFIDPKISLFDVNQAMDVARGGSATTAGHLVRIDVEEGYHNSPSNRKVYGINGSARTIDYIVDDKNCTANILSANNICCFIRKTGGVFFWGNRLANGTLIPHQRLRYIVGDSIVKAHEEYIDRNLTTNYYEFILGRVNKFIRRLVLEKKIAGGECWLDKELNIETAPTNTVYFDYKLGFFNVAETIIFRQHVTDEYTNEIISNISA